MASTPKYSIIVPVRDGEAVLPGCLASLSHQTIPPSEYETIVVDDGSGDGTARVASAASARVIRQSHAGPATARNRGASEAPGELLLFIDADCVAEHDWLERMIAPFADPSVAATMGRYRTRQTSPLATFVQMDIEDRYRRLRAGEEIDTVFSHSAAFRRRLFLAEGGFDQRFPDASNEDTELSYRLASRGHRMLFVPDAVVYHRHPERLAQYFRVKVGRGYWRTLVYTRYVARSLRDSYTPFVLKLQILLVFLAIGSAPLFLLRRKFLIVPLTIVVVHFLTTLPFAARAWATERRAALASPFYLLVRSVAFALGMVLAFPRLWRFQ